MCIRYNLVLPFKVSHFLTVLSILLATEEHEASQEEHGLQDKEKDHNFKVKAGMKETPQA